MPDISSNLRAFSQNSSRCRCASEPSSASSGTRAWETVLGFSPRAAKSSSRSWSASGPPRKPSTKPWPCADSCSASRSLAERRGLAARESPAGVMAIVSLPRFRDHLGAPGSQEFPSFPREGRGNRQKISRSFDCSRSQLELDWDSGSAVFALFAAVAEGGEEEDEDDGVESCTKSSEMSTTGHEGASSPVKMSTSNSQESSSFDSHL
mmetsp:Transcript_383/g.869  ORF Transcript_383/g.869 Transcript_383/m.869 type:complete len:208 (-) Transcript_383:1210-1833(-)